MYTEVHRVPTEILDWETAPVVTDMGSIFEQEPVNYGWGSAGRAAALITPLASACAAIVYGVPRLYEQGLPELPTIPVELNVDPQQLGVWGTIAIAAIGLWRVARHRRRAVASAH